MLNFSILELLEIQAIWENLISEFPLAMSDLDFEAFADECWLEMPGH